MDLNLRKEKIADHQEVFNVIKKAFEKEEYSDQQEHFLVQRLRASKNFIPNLSIVAERDGKVVGHILLTRIDIIDGSKSSESLALAPVSVLPTYQRKGIGGKLIVYAHEIAKGLGYKSVILVGHKDYYPKFGYFPLKSFGIKLPFDANDENCMAIELVEGALQEAHGKVQYAVEFFQEE